MLGGDIYSQIDSIRVMSPSESRSSVSTVLGGLPAANAVEIDWLQVPHDVIGTYDDEDEALANAIVEVLEAGTRTGRRILLLWEYDLCIEMELEFLKRHARELVENGSPFSLYIPDRNILIDYQSDGLLAAAVISDYLERSR